MQGAKTKKNSAGLNQQHNKKQLSKKSFVATHQKLYASHAIQIEVESIIVFLNLLESSKIFCTTALLQNK